MVDTTDSERFNPGRRSRLALCALLTTLGVIASGCTYDWGPSGDADGQCVIRVDHQSTASAPDGRSWESAYPKITDGIDAAAPHASALRHCEVWVAEGTYYAFSESPTDTVRLAPHVDVYGGFDATETTREERDWRGHETVLSGRRGPDDDDRVLHVVTGADDAALDGFTITAGRADGAEGPHPQCGGGMLNDSASPVVRNCTFAGNAAEDSGGGVCNVGGAPLFEGCLLLANAAPNGGGMYNESSSPTIERCRFEANTGKRGGGIDSRRSEVVLTNALILSNYAGKRGGGVRAEEGELTLFNCTVVGNAAEDGGGGLDIKGGGLAWVANSVLWGNVADEHPSPLVSDGTLTVSHSVVEGGFDGPGNHAADPRLVDPEAGDLRLRPGSPCIDAGDGSKAPPADLDGRPRRDDPATPNTGEGDPTFVDLGAYEYQPTATSGGDDE